MEPGRRAHYADFYDGSSGAGPFTVVHGNCQAESLRVLLAGSPGAGPAVRIPPVHELTAADLGPLRALLARTAVFVAQPVRSDYRDLPVGTDQLAALLPRGARVLRVPVIRHLGLHPYAALVRHPADPALAPPVVPYHDLRTLVTAAGHRPPDRPAAARVLRAVGDSSVAEQARRERAHCDVGVADLLLDAGARAAHTLNHPGNPVLIALARRVQAALDLPVEAADPGRTLLGEIRAPLEQAVIDAWALDAPARPHWTVRGESVDDVTVRDAQLAWYADHPGWVEAGLARHADRITLLEL